MEAGHDAGRAATEAQEAAPAAGMGLADQLRSAAQGIGHGAHAGRADALRQERVEEERQRAKELEQVRVRMHEQRGHVHGDDDALEH